MYTVERESPEPPESQNAFKSPSSSVVLKYCRCVDCRRWDLQNAACHEMGLVTYVPREAYHPAMRRFWSDLGMVRPEAWHYCQCYDGPAVSTDVWIWTMPQRQAQSEQVVAVAKQPVRDVPVNVPVSHQKATRRNVPSLFDGPRAIQDVLVEPVVAGRVEAESERAM